MYECGQSTATHADCNAELMSARQSYEQSQQPRSVVPQRELVGEAEGKGMSERKSRRLRG